MHNYAYLYMLYICDQLCNIGPYLNMYFDGSMTIMVENLKLRQIIAYIDFLCMYQQKENFGENRIFG